MIYVIVSYDISEDKRRTRVFKILKDYGQWIQYSVFECKLEEQDYLKMRARLEKVIDRDEDSIRLHFLCANCQGKIEKIGGPTDKFEDSIII